MIVHYLRSALRNLSRQKGFVLINISGLSIGLACFILFLLYSVNELSFDRFHSNADNIFRVYRWSEAWQGQEARGTSTMPMPLGPAMKAEFPEVINYVRINERQENFVKADDKVSRVEMAFADPQFFTVFSFRFISGDPSNSLKDPKNVVLTKSKALQLFGTTNVIGKTIEVKVSDKFDPLVVSAVCDDIPANSSFSYEMVASWEYMETFSFWKSSRDKWNRSGFQTFVVLQPGSTLMNQTDKLAAFRKKYYPNEESDAKNTGGWKGPGSPISFRLQPLKSIHTSFKIVGGSVEPIDPGNIWTLLGIAAAVLIMSCINFTTLAIGRSARRAKEIGVRKVMGSNKRNLVFQFLAEALLLTVFSACIGLLLAQALLPSFNELSGRELSFSISHYPEIAWLLIGLVLIVGFLAGSYPALVLSSFKPIEVLKSKIKLAGSNVFTRSLVTIQFIVSIALIISTIVILQQISFMRDKNPGFNKENIVMIDASGVKAKKIYPLIKQALEKEPSVISVAASSFGIGEGNGWSQWGFEYNDVHKDVYEYYVDTGYINLMGIQLLAGRNFNAMIASDTITSVIVNEELVKDFGWTMKNAIGQELKGFYEATDHKNPVVIGVVKNFNFRPLSEKVGPQMFHQFTDYGPYKFFVRIAPGNPTIPLKAMNKAWTDVVEDIPLRYDFLDESVDRFYKAETRWSGIVGWAGGISIFLACLGLFGLAALAAVNRIKEIGIRKVLGASIASITMLLAKDFLKLVIIAFVIASPVAWYLMHQWLQDFAYRIHITWWMFIGSAVVVILIAFVTVSFQSVKAGLINPVKV